ncbi:MAG: hypothetical protein SVR94_03855 [Pseudomonadota bacterium]|nr:hypothetical protein [Pseudomonadota bacterium]
MPFTELSAAGLDLLVGILFDSAQRQQWVSQTFKSVTVLTLLLWLLLPYVTPIFYSVDFADFEDRWSVYKPPLLLVVLQVLRPYSRPQVIQFLNVTWLKNVLRLRVALKIGILPVP